MLSTLTGNWLNEIDGCVAAFEREHAEELGTDDNNSIVDPAAAALANDVAQAQARVAALQARLTALGSEAQRVLAAARLAPCAALQRVTALGVALLYDQLERRSAALLQRVRESDDDPDDDGDSKGVALCDALRRAAAALEPHAAGGAPKLLAMLQRRASDALSARRAHHVDACRRALDALGWPDSLRDDDVDSAPVLRRRVVRHMRALDALQRLAPTGVSVRWALDALVAPLATRFRFHFGGARPTNRNDKPEWVYAHIRTLLRDSLPLALRLDGVDARHWIAALVRLGVERVARTLVDLPPDRPDDAGALLRHVVAETLAFEAELLRIHSYPNQAADDDDDGAADDAADVWPLPSDAIVHEAPPSYAGAMQWHALEYDDLAAAWRSAVVDAESLRGAPAALLQCAAASAARATQLSSRARRTALLRETLVRGAGLARSTVQAIGFARCDAGDVRGAALALDAADRMADALADAAATPLVMSTAPDLLADELSALAAMRQALLVSLVQQFLLSPLARAVGPLLQARGGGARASDGGAVSSTMAAALCDLQRDLELVRDASGARTARSVVLELCGAVDAFVFDTLWAAQPTLSAAAAAQLGADLGAAVRLLDAFTDPLPARNFLRRAHELAVLFGLKRAEREHLRDIISRADEALVLAEFRANDVFALAADLPKLLIALKWIK